jgi:hypothetical protein
MHGAIVAGHRRLRHRACEAGREGRSAVATSQCDAGSLRHAFSPGSGAGCPAPCLGCAWRPTHLRNVGSVEAPLGSGLWHDNMSQ